MTRIFIFFIGILLSTIVVMVAHPPSNMELSYDNETQILEVFVEHNVGNTSNHYVENLTVTHNDREILVHHLTEQENEDGVTFKYRLPNAEQGMVIKVTAECSRVGSISEEINID